MSLLLKQEALAKRINQHYTGIIQSARAKESPIHYLETRLETLEIYWKDCYDLHWSILTSPEHSTSDYVVKSLFDVIEEDYTATKAAIKREIQNLVTVKQVPPQLHQRRGNISYDNTYKHLPALTLPKFSGNQLEWETFRDLFTAMVDKTKLSDVQKLYYLKSSLTGKAAERIKNLAVNETNYLDAWSMLTRRYNNKRTLLAAHMRKLLSCPAASKRSVDEILRLLDATNESIRAFTNMERPVDLWDDWFVHLLVHKLDPCTREEWEISLRDSEEFPSYDDLSSFLESTVRPLEASHPAQNSSSNTPKPQTVKGRKSTVLVNLSQTDPTPSPYSKLCPVCQSAHFISYCPQFKKLKGLQRLEQAKRLKLCFNCLRGNHKLEDCTSQKRCFVCSANHRTFLHDSFQPKQTAKGSEPTPSTSSSEQVVCHASYQTNHISDHVSGNSKGIFATAYITLTSSNGKSILVKGFLDSGSECTLITERVAQQLKLPKLKCDVSLKGIGNSSIGSSNYKVNLWLQSPRDSKFKLPLHALVLKSLIQLVPKIKPKHSEWQHLKDLELADPNYHLSESIDCVLGIDLLGHILLPGLKQGPINSPTALLTTFGWIIFGGSSSTTDHKNTTSVLHIEERESLNQQLRCFWEVEEVPKTIFLSKEEIECESLFRDTHYRNQSVQYVVQLPKLKSPYLLGQSKETVVSMFKRNETQLLKDPDAKVKYNTFMNDYLLLNHMEPVAEEAQSLAKSNYLPHDVITKTHDPSSKIRVVFNGSFRTSSGVSLNDILHPGQKLQQDIWLIISRWRFWKFVFTADIVKMFRQIKIQSPDCNLQRIVWRADLSQPLQEYNLPTVTYGTRPAPFLAIRVLKQLASDEGDRFPLGAQVLINNTYVDDIYPGANSLQRAIEIRDDLINILASSDISLSKWAANDNALLPDCVSETSTLTKSSILKILCPP